MKAKKLLALVLACLMVLTLVACGPQSGNNPTGAVKPTGDGKPVEAPDYMNMDSQMPIVKEGTDITLKIMVVNGPMYSNMDSLRDVYFTEAYEKKTGVKIEWIEVSSDAFADQLALKLTTGDKETIAATMKDLMGRRREKQPLEYPSAGSMFKRPVGYFAGALIEQAGLKGFSVGGAQVSEKHAGFVVNRGGATCSDVLELVRQVQEKVKVGTGVDLEMEVKILR